VQRVANQKVGASDFELERVPGHLLPSFRAVDGRGRAVGSDRGLLALQERLSARARDSVASSIERAASSERRGAASGPDRVAGARPPAERTGITTWDIGELPELVDTKVAGGVVRGYPALVDEGASVALRVESTPDAAARATRAGVRRLVLLAVASPTAYVQEHLTSAEKLALATSPYPSARALIEDCRVAVADAVIARVAPTGIVRNPEDFARVRDAVSAAVVDDLFSCVSLVAKVLTRARDVERALKAGTSMALLGALNDIRGQLSGLIHLGFVSQTGLARLSHLPRYLEGALVRLQGLPDNPGRDRAWMTEFERAAAAFADAGGTIPLPPDAPSPLVRTRWLLEEYRVSLFAQRLGTAEPVSLQRITKSLRSE
jgi:ATP-dependent helicase HrpA